MLKNNLIVDYSMKTSSFPMTSAISLAILLIVSSDRDTFLVNCLSVISLFLLLIQKYTNPAAVD